MDLIDRPASRRTALKVGWLVAIAVVVLTIVAGAKHLAMGGLAETEITDGEEALARAVSGDRGAYVEAEEAFRNAASVTVFDYYPAFGLTVTRRLRELQNGTPATKAGDQVLRAILEKEWGAAQAEVSDMRSRDPSRAAYYERLVGALQSSMKIE